MRGPDPAGSEGWLTDCYGDGELPPSLIMLSRIRPRTFLLSGALLLVAATLNAAPANLARSDAGTRLTLLAPAADDGGDNAARATQALLGEADPLGCALGTGTTTILLSLPRAETLHRFDFLNLTAVGRVSVAVSNVALPAGSPRWRTLPAAGQTFGTPDEVVACDLGQIEARHLRIIFETQTAGRIDTFGLFGAAPAETSASPRPRFVAFGMVGSGGGGRAGDDLSRGASVLRASSGSGPLDHIVDGSLGTGHAFAPDDRRPTALIDLGRQRSLARVNLACRTTRPGRLEVYALTRREEADASLSPADHQPAGTARVEGRNGLTRVTVPLEAENVRYLAVVFVPTTGAAGGKDFKNATDLKNPYADRAGEAGNRASSEPVDSSAGGPGGDGTGSGNFVLTEVMAVGPGGSAGFGGTGGEGLASDGVQPPGSNSGAFNFANAGGPGAGGGSSLGLVPILPPPVGSDLITP